MTEENLQNSTWTYEAGISGDYGPVTGASVLRKWLAGWIEPKTEVRTHGYSGPLSQSPLAKNFETVKLDRTKFLVSQFLYPELIGTRGPYDRPADVHISFVDPAAVKPQSYQCDSCDFEKQPVAGPSKVNVYFGGDVFLEGDWYYGWCDRCDNLEIATFFRAAEMQSRHQIWASDFYRWLNVTPKRFSKRKEDLRIVRDQSLMRLDERLDILEFLDEPYEYSALCIKCGGHVSNLLVEGDYLDPEPIKHSCGGMISGHYRNRRMDPKADFFRGTFENGDMGWVSTLQLRERGVYARLLEDKILDLLG